MLLNGYICLYRSLLNWEWHDNPFTGWLFVNLLLLANIAPANWQGITLKRGQVVTGRKALAAQTGLSERQVRTALDHLEKTGELTIKTTSKYSLITIVNYGKFQDFSEFPTSKATNDRPTTDQQSTTKEEEKQKRKKPPSPKEVQEEAENPSPRVYGKKQKNAQKTNCTEITLLKPKSKKR